MRLKGGIFTRNRFREEQYGFIFNKASMSFNFLVNVLIAGVFAPAVIVTSQISKDALLMLANIILSVG